MDHGRYAEELFTQGYNCAQAVFVSYCDLTGLAPEFAAKLSSSFGGGMGRLREVCGAVSGMFMVAGILYGYSDPASTEDKKKHYALIQELAAAFKEKAGSIVCRELLENPASDPSPTPRTPEFYKKRPCAYYVRLAAEILEDHIAKHPISN